MPTITFKPWCTEIRRYVTAVQTRPGYKHVTGWAVEVREVTFLHNNYIVPHMAVYKVYMEVGAHRRPPIAYPQWTLYGTGYSMEGGPI